MMDLKDFIGKAVISKKSKTRYIITKIDGVAIYAESEKPSNIGTHSYYMWETGTGPCDNAIANGSLVFEDSSLTKPFISAYEEYTNTKGRYDQLSYYMSKYD